MSDSNRQRASKDKCTTIFLFRIGLRRRILVKPPGVDDFERPAIIHAGLTKQESRSPIIPLDLIGEGEETLEAAIVKAANYRYERHRPKQGTSNGEATVVLLNGLFGGGWIWDSAWKALTEDNDHDVVRFPDSFARLDMTIDSPVVWRTWLIDFLNTTQIRHPILCGNSLGGLIVLDFAAAFPDRVDAVVSSGSPGMTRRGLLDPAGDSSMSMLNKTDLIAERVFHNPEVLTPEIARLAYADIRSPKRFRSSLRALRLVQEYDATDIPAEIRCPVLLIWGDNDRVTPIEDWIPHLEKLKNYELVQIENCGHSPQLEKPEEFNRALLDFLKRRDEIRGSQRPDCEVNPVG
jgi:2-hydroxy-6-oxonona-2,4-dienedioate hydrolase